VLTAPYFEICLTKRDANLNRGKGTILEAGPAHMQKRAPLDSNMDGRATHWTTQPSTADRLYHDNDRNSHHLSRVEHS
jgi:hypothetical protein